MVRGNAKVLATFDNILHKISYTNFFALYKIPYKANRQNMLLRQ